MCRKRQPALLLFVSAAPHILPNNTHIPNLASSRIVPHTSSTLHHGFMPTAQTPHVMTMWRNIFRSACRQKSKHLQQQCSFERARSLQGPPEYHSCIMPSALHSLRTHRTPLSQSLQCMLRDPPIQGQRKPIPGTFYAQTVCTHLRRMGLRADSLGVRSPGDVAPPDASPRRGAISTEAAGVPVVLVLPSDALPSCVRSGLLAELLGRAGRQSAEPPILSLIHISEPTRPY